MINRETLRRLQHLPAAQFYQAVVDTVNDEVERARAYTFNNLAACLFTALRQRFPDIMTGDMLHSIAQDTIDLNNEIETPSELDAVLLEETGFSIYEPVNQSKLNYIEKG